MVLIGLKHRWFRLIPISTLNLQMRRLWYIADSIKVKKRTSTLILMILRPFIKCLFNGLMLMRIFIWILRASFGIKVNKWKVAKVTLRMFLLKNTKLKPMKAYLLQLQSHWETDFHQTTIT